MTLHASSTAIDDLTELALYAERAFFSDITDDDMYWLCEDGIGEDIEHNDLVEAYHDHIVRRMYFLFIVEYLKGEAYDD